MNSQAKNNRKLIIITIIFLIFTAAAVIIAFIINRPHLSITNFNNYAKTAKSSDKKSLEELTWNLITNTTSVDQNSYITANIREDSYKENRNKTVYTATFLLDIDSIKRTYNIEFSWSNTEEIVDGIVVNCPKKQDSKYPDEECIGMYNDFSSIELYLPYKSTLSNNKTFEAREGYNIETSDYQISIYTDSCGFDKYEKEAEEKTKSYLKASDIPISDYKFETIDTCTSYRSQSE